MSQDKILYKLSGSDTNKALQNTLLEVYDKLNLHFGNEYEIASDKFQQLLGEDWSHEISIRKGKKIGLAVNLQWHKNYPEFVELSFDESSKLGNQITYGIIFPFLVLGAYLAYQDMAPLAFLPGKKVAAGLGGLIALIPASLLVYFIKSKVLKNEAEENASLMEEVQKTLQA